MGDIEHMPFGEIPHPLLAGVIPLPVGEIPMPFGDANSPGSVGDIDHTPVRRCGVIIHPPARLFGVIPVGGLMDSPPVVGEVNTGP